MPWLRRLVRLFVCLSVPLWFLVDTVPTGRDLLQLLLVNPPVQLTYPLTYHWCYLISAGWIENPTSRPDANHARSDKYQCRIDTVIFSWWWAHGCPEHVEKRNKYIKQNCAPSWTYLQDYRGMRCRLVELKSNQPTRRHTYRVTNTSVAQLQ